MKKNVGNIDRVIRVLVAVVCAVLYFTGTVRGVWGIVLLVVGGAMLLSAVVGFCGLYTLFGINTCPVKQKE